MHSADEISRTIRGARLRRGMSQEVAAHAVGVSRLQWIRWEKGVHPPSEANRAKLADVLGVDESRLVHEEVPSDPLTLLVRSVVEREVRREVERALRDMRRTEALA
jgi:transcriptional regulator with XRE-family HTH domain